MIIQSSCFVLIWRGKNRKKNSTTREITNAEICNQKQEKADTNTSSRHAICRINAPKLKKMNCVFTTIFMVFMCCVRVWVSVFLLSNFALIPWNMVPDDVLLVCVECCSRNGGGGGASYAFLQCCYFFFFFFWIK